MPATTLPIEGYEQVVRVRDDEAGYHGIIAIHSTRLGPALGGTRMRAYGSEEEALTDVLRLARGMTYKCAAAELPLGGGKSVIIADGATSDRRRVLRAHGRAVDQFGGRYITSVDIGTTPTDMVVIRETTSYVNGLPDELDDPSPVTARGVLRAIQGALRYVRGSDDLAGRTVAIQGCGQVGYSLARQLALGGAKVFAADPDERRLHRAARDCAVTPVVADSIYDLEVDVFAPCALGGVLNDATIPRLRCAIVAGAANNQLLEDRHGAALAERSIVYVPDYVANAGGATYLCRVLADWLPERVNAHVDSFDRRVFDLLSHAAAEQIPTNVAADRIAEQRLSE
jgi:leucine dehydrogenase